jgi:hypothetical protein
MAYKGDMVQEVHTDGGCETDKTATVAPGAEITGFSVNFPLCDQTVQSGATQYWPGSHRDLGLIHGDADPNGRYPTATMLAEYEVSAAPPPPLPTRFRERSTHPLTCITHFQFEYGCRRRTDPPNERSWKLAMRLCATLWSGTAALPTILTSIGR